MGHKFTSQEYDIIYSMRFLAGQRQRDVSTALGRNESSISRVCKWMQTVLDGDLAEARRAITSGDVNGTVAEPWAEKRLNIKIPTEPEPEPEPEPAPEKMGNNDTPAPDMTGEYLTRLLSAQAAQNEILRTLLDAVKSYGPAILSDMQRLSASHTRMAESMEKMEAAILKLDEAIHDTGKDLAADLKDNLNANSDVLRQELDTICKNTRKRGL